VKSEVEALVKDERPPEAILAAAPNLPPTAICCLSVLMFCISASVHHKIKSVKVNVTGVYGLLGKNKSDGNGINDSRA
jgi:hypothetical protein